MLKTGDGREALAGDEVVATTLPDGNEVDAGDSVEAIAELYELERDDVEAALRYERERIKAQNPAAA